MKAIFCLSIGIFAILRIFTLASHNTYKQACSFEFGLGKSIRDSLALVQMVEGLIILFLMYMLHILSLF